MIERDNLIISHLRKDQILEGTLDCTCIRDKYLSWVFIAVKRHRDQSNSYKDI